MLSLTDSTIFCAGLPLLAGLPPGVSARADSAGLFLHFSLRQPAARHVLPLGIPHAIRFAAAHRTEPFWMRPAVTRDAAKIPVETQVLFAELADGRVALFVPLISTDARCSLEGTPDDTLALVAESGNPTVTFNSITALFVAVQPANEPSLRAWLSRCAAAVAKHLDIPLRHEKPLPNFVNTLGWCTWDAFYMDVSPEKILHGLQTLRDAGIAPKFLILDDGWQTEQDFGKENGRRLTALAPNQKFAGNLSAILRTAKQNFGIQTALAWHALQGYWSGLDPASLPQYAPRDTPREFSPGILHHWPDANTQWWGRTAGTVRPAHIAQFFDDYHALLKSQGIDGVKVDNQATLESLAHGTPLSRVAFADACRHALEASTQKHFAGNLLNCMSCANDLLYHTAPSALVRTSTDFWPAKPETHGTHLWTNALVALWFGHFIHPDWDMFQSALPAPHAAWSSFHAAARAISGGPIYLSDQPGQHNAALLKQLVHSDGTIPRCDRPAEIARDSLFTDLAAGKGLLKITNTARHGTAGIIGLFNCHYSPNNPAPPIAGTLSAADLPELAGHDRYLLHLRTSITEERGIGILPMSPRIVSAHEQVQILLAQNQWALATLIPIINGIAILGLLDKLNPAATITNITRTGLETRLYVRDEGTLGFWCLRSFTLDFEGAEVAIQRAGPWMSVRIPHAGSTVIRMT